MIPIDVATVEEVEVGVYGAELPDCKPGSYALEQLPDAPFLWYRLRPDHAWGTEALVEAIESAATRMATLYPSANPILVGDLSSRRGGPLPPHKWHFDGRSADIGLYSTVVRPTYAWGMGFPPIRARQLDAPRTWALMEAMLDTGAVEHILLGQQHIDVLRRWLIESGRRTEAEVATLFPPKGFTGGVVRPAPHHDDHFHVRVSCRRD